MLLRNSARIFYIGEKQVDGQYEILTFVFQRFEILFQRAWIRGSYLCKRNCTFFTCRDVTKRNRFYNTFLWKSNLSIQWIINYWNGNVILIFVKLSKICPLLAVQDTSLFNYRLLGDNRYNETYESIRLIRNGKDAINCGEFFEFLEKNFRKGISWLSKTRIAKFFLLITQRRKCKRLSDLGRIYTGGPVVLHFFIIPSDTFRQDN